jgi:AcrR family transcriptional regulator
MTTLKKPTPKGDLEDAPSPRQREVLDAALRLLIRDGAITMGALAAEANCSKESLYRWYGDRDGLLNAIVRSQAAQVRVAPVEGGKIDRAALVLRLTQFASDWLKVVSSDTSLALNRLAIGHAGDDTADLGAVVLGNGRFALGQRLKPVLEAGRAAGLLKFESAEEAFRTFFGLVARDAHIRLLLGERLKLDRATEAARAVDQFMTLYQPAKRAG